MSEEVDSREEAPGRTEGRESVGFDESRDDRPGAPEGIGNALESDEKSDGIVRSFTPFRGMSYTLRRFYAVSHHNAEDSTMFPLFRADGSPYIIAECCNNFQNSIEIAEDMIYEAKRAGADAVKFQHRRRISTSQLNALGAAAQRAGLNFLCTAYDEAGVDELVELGIQVLKVGSAEATNIPFLKHVASKGLPTIVSTGCMSAADVRSIDAVFEDIPLAMMHTVSIYPTPPAQAGLFLLKNLCDGYSDHTARLEVVAAAIAMGARIVEMHVTISRNLPGPDQQVSFEFPELRSLVEFARAWPEMSRAKPKVPLAEERVKIDQFRKPEWRR